MNFRIQQPNEHHYLPPGRFVLPILHVKTPQGNGVAFPTLHTDDSHRDTPVVARKPAWMDLSRPLGVGMMSTPSVADAAVTPPPAAQNWRYKAADLIAERLNVPSVNVVTFHRYEDWMDDLREGRQAPPFWYHLVRKLGQGGCLIDQVAEAYN